jgi:hypothetical protein
VRFWSERSRSLRRFSGDFEEKLRVGFIVAFATTHKALAIHLDRVADMVVLALVEMKGELKPIADHFDILLIGELGVLKEISPLKN